MANRRPLEKMIHSALESVVEEVYEQQLVNSEASFQAAMWEALRWQFELNDKRNFKIFIEPRLAMLGSDKQLPPSVRYPDLVICNRDAVIGVLELKFKPRSKASSMKDVETFAMLAKNRKELVVKNQRFFPKTEMKEYRMSDSVLFGWIAIAKQAGAIEGVKGIQSEHLRPFVYLTERQGA